MQFYFYKNTLHYTGYGNKNEMFTQGQVKTMSSESRVWIIRRKSVWTQAANAFWKCYKLFNDDDDETSDT
jgi:hypothetical protein